MKKYISCGFSEAEIQQFDQLVNAGVFTSRSDAVRMCATETLARRMKS